MSKKTDGSESDVRDGATAAELTSGGSAGREESARVEEQISTGGAAETQPANETKIHIDDSRVAASYANFCRVSSTPEEVILDLGLNPQPFGAAADTTISVSQRIVLNHYTVKRLVAALNAALNQHEQVFGVLETDVRKRVHPGS